MNRSKTALFVLVLSFLLVFLNLNRTAYAASLKGPVQKLARGVVHLVTCPFQLPKGIIDTTAESETVWIAPLKGMTEGVGRGLYQMCAQALSGLIDIVTFWTPAGHDWKPIFDSPSLFPQV